MSFRGLTALLAALLIGLVTVLVTQSVSAETSGPYRGLWLSQAELEALPTSGPAWDGLVDVARGRFESADIADNKSDHDTQTFAAALVAARTGDGELERKVVNALDAAIGTEEGDNALSLSRNLVAYVLAADLINLPSASPSVDSRFRSWLDSVRYKDLDGRTLINTHEDRPNNWGTHAGASRMAAALYLGDTNDFNKAATTFKGLLGDRSAYSGFRYGDLDWQADPSRPVGINPPGATINGHNVDGVLPDDQRRGGDFKWPPPCENYVREAMQGMVVQAELLRRQGQDAFQWSDRALLRAANWLTDTANCEFEGDDEWMAPLLNAAYGTSFQVDVPARPGKHVGFTDWTHGEARGQRAVVTTTNSPTTNSPTTNSSESSSSESNSSATDSTTTTEAASADETAPETTALRVNTDPDVTQSSTTTEVPTPTARRAGRDEAGDPPSACTIVGTDGPDVLIGTDGDDVICGLGGDDEIIAGRGDDLVFAGPGNDRVMGERGRDILNGEDGNDYLDGGRSGDLLDGGDGDDELHGGSARDTIIGGAGNDNIHAGSGDDIVMAGDGDDTVVGENGDDYIDAGPGTNRVDGGDDYNMCANPSRRRVAHC